MNKRFAIIATLSAAAAAAFAYWWSQQQSDGGDAEPQADPTGSKVKSKTTAAQELLKIGFKPGQSQPGWAKQPPYYYKPGGSDQIGLFEWAAQDAGVPVAWASSDEFVKLLASESGGWVGRPNYLYGDVSNTAHASEWPQLWAILRQGKKHFPAIKSRAIGLGQFIPANIEKLYPSGYAGIGIPKEEAIGMLRYIKQRYGNPKAAWDFHQKNNWY